MAAESIAKLLGENTDLRPLSERLELIKRLQKRYRTLVPEGFAAASRVCAIDGTTVVICAASGPVAAALRHLAPRLLEGLRAGRKNPKQQRDQELTALRIEVQVEVPAPKGRVLGRVPIPRAKLAALGDKLGDSPLKETLERIGREDAAGRPQSRSTRSKT